MFQNQQQRTMSTALLEGECAGGCPTGGAGDDADDEGQQDDGQQECRRSMTTDVEGSRRSTVTDFYMAVRDAEGVEVEHIHLESAEGLVWQNH
jgi:hypothetical protein